MVGCHISNKGSKCHHLGTEHLQDLLDVYHARSVWPYKYNSLVKSHLDCLIIVWWVVYILCYKSLCFIPGSIGCSISSWLSKDVLMSSAGRIAAVVSSTGTKKRSIKDFRLFVRKSYCGCSKSQHYFWNMPSFLHSFSFHTCREQFTSPYSDNTNELLVLAFQSPHCFPSAL